MRFTIAKFEESRKDEILRTFSGKIMRAGNDVLIAKLGTSNIPLRDGTYIIKREDKDDICLCDESSLTQTLEILSHER